MIEHNLLSQKERRELVQQLWYLIGKRFVISVSVVLVLVTGSLYANRYLLVEEGKQLDERIQQSLQETVLKEGGPLQDNIREINSTLSVFQTVQSSFIPLSPFLEQFFRNVPGGISIFSVTMNASTRSFGIEGTAKTRADLLKLRSDLEKFYAFSNVQSSGSDLTQRENIDFTISATLKNDFWVVPTDTEINEPST